MAIRPSTFGLAYLLALGGLVAVPSTTIDGRPPTLPTRTAELAVPLPDAPPAPPPPPVVTTRGSAAAVIDAPARPSPTHLRLPAVGIDGPITPVGIADDRQLDIPPAELAGWYEHSSTPLTGGASVIAAHVDFGGRPGLFFTLGQTEVGDVVEIELGDGTRLRYVVSDVSLHDKTALPAAELFRRAGPHVLHLVTCGGTFDPVLRTYLGNLVVSAVPV